MSALKFDDGTLKQMEKEKTNMEKATSAPGGDTPGKETPEGETPEKKTPGEEPTGAETPEGTLTQAQTQEGKTDISFNLPDAKANEEPADAGATKTVPLDTPADKIFDPFVKKKIEAGGFTTEEVKTRILKDGGITEQFSTELKKTIDPDLVDTYIQDLSKGVSELKQANATAVNPDADLVARNARRAELNTFIYDTVGGKEKFEILSKTLRAEVSADALSLLNAKLSSTNKGLVAEGMKEAVAQYKKITGRDNSRMQGTPMGADGKPFEFLTKEAYHLLMRSEKYRTDPIYAKEIDQKRLKSRNLDAQVSLPGQYRMVRDGQMYAL